MVRQWAQRYLQGGLAGMASQWATQNAAKLTESQRDALKQRLHEHQPDDLLDADIRLSQGAFWTVSDLQIAVKHWYGVVYRDEGSYRRLLHQCGFSYQRTEAVYRSQADEQKRADFEQHLEKKSRTS
ncbi:MAG: winged helix-turn-helix domain-containing protein [Chloroflexota bacterium]